MARILIVGILIVSLIAVGCNKKDEDVEAISQEAAQDNAAAVMDSLAGQGAESETGTAAMTGTGQAAAPEETSPRVPETDLSDLEGYVVQIGSYAEYSFARMMADKYVNREYPAFVTTADLDGVTYYRLRIGVYETYDEAKQIGELVKDRYSAGYWIDQNR